MEENTGYISIHRGTKKMRKEKYNRRITDKDKYKLTKEREKQLKEKRYMGAQQYLETVQMNQEVMRLQKDDPVDLSNYDAVSARVNDYFEIMKKYKSKPTVAGLAMALGIDRNKLGGIMSGRNQTERYTPEVRELLHQVYTMYESMWETYMLEGYVNPNAGIFIAKNQFGYKDVIEHEVTTEIKPQIDAESIKNKYKYIGADNELPEEHGKDDAENE